MLPNASPFAIERMSVIGAPSSVTNSWLASAFEGSNRSTAIGPASDSCRSSGWANMNAVRGVAVTVAVGVVVAVAVGIGVAVKAGAVAVAVGAVVLVATGWDVCVTVGVYVPVGAASVLSESPQPTADTIMIAVSHTTGSRPTFTDALRSLAISLPLCLRTNAKTLLLRPIHLGLHASGRGSISFFPQASWPRPIPGAWVTALSAAPVIPPADEHTQHLREMIQPIDLLVQ